MPDTRSTIAIVDDDDSIRLALGTLLRAAEREVLAFASAEEFLASPDTGPIGCVIADVHLPGMTGVALLAAMADAGREIPAILITARDDAATIALLQHTGGVPWLRKPFSEAELFGALAALGF
jgi:FixJ family two-component response regulator